ncbi:MAG: hypothetical protein LBG80_07965 [Bacteroidales bacterium]|jgi:hypothetical protein|nr:hypothetical protein [Bacteroidales bacterium]
MILDDRYRLKNPELEAEIYYLTTKEGGRKSLVVNGYRGQFFYNGNDWDIQQEFINKDICNLGETIRVYIQTLSPDFHVGKFFVGKNFEIREGEKIVGQGKITKVIRPDFYYWDFESFYQKLPPESQIFDRINIENLKTYMKISLKNVATMNLKFIETFSNRNTMLTIQCFIKNKNISLRQIADRICEIWKNYQSRKNSFYKVELNVKGEICNFEILFAMWNNMYLTGKILITR